MKRAPKAFIWDVHLCCQAISTFVQGQAFSRYVSDLMLRSAVERQLQNIGEALSQLAKQDPVLAARVPRHRSLIGFRNILVHGYASLNDDEVWRVLHENLPELDAAVLALLAELDQEPLP